MDRMFRIRISDFRFEISNLQFAFLSFLSYESCPSMLIILSANVGGGESSPL
jgi:hypothetical protein